MNAWRIGVAGILVATWLAWTWFNWLVSALMSLDEEWEGWPDHLLNPYIVLSYLVPSALLLVPAYLLARRRTRDVASAKVTAARAPAPAPRVPNVPSRGPEALQTRHHSALPQGRSSGPPWLIREPWNATSPSVTGRANQFPQRRADACTASPVRYSFRKSRTSCSSRK